jgi:hypothetical protein
MCRYEKKISILCLAASFLKESDISDLRFFSKFEEMKRVLTWKCRFIGNSWTPKSKRSGELSVDELKFAENLVLCWLKRSHLVAFRTNYWLVRIHLKKEG